MLDINKNYWLYIASHVYCCIKDIQAILYNTKTGMSFVIDDKDIILLLQSLHEKKNLGAVFCTGKLLSKTPYKEFITDFCQKGMGDIVDVVLLPEKPIQMMPVLNLQSDVSKLPKEEIGKDVLHYLLELNIYLHNECELHCPNCDNFYRQSLCCSKNNGGKSKDKLDINVLKNILYQIRDGSVGKLNLLGGNIFKYPFYSVLPELLANFRGSAYFWNHYANFNDEEVIFSDFYYVVVVTFPVENKLLDCCFNILRNNNAKYHFYITNIEEYEKAEYLIEEYKINDYTIHPIYIGQNDDFFRKYIYSRHEDIYQIKLSFHQIFAHQKMNTNNFGTLTILPDCEVYGNINAPALGDIKDNTLLYIIEKEMIENTAWRQVRDMVPCNECIYQYLCPSPSNYELVIGKPNLCHVKQ